MVDFQIHDKWLSYSVYKDSGVEWLGVIPSHWDLRRLKFVSKVNPSRTEVSNLPNDYEVSYLPMELIGFGRLDLGQTKQIEEVKQGYTYVRDGDIILAKITPSFENGKGAIAEGLTNGIGFGTTELHVIRPNEIINRKYLFYITESHMFRHVGTGMMQGTAGQKRVPNNFIAEFRLPLPPFLEQQAIVAFLDRETAKIDTLIEKKQRLIALLQEKRNALISSVVTEGLDSNVPFRDSGIAWLKELPSHWKEERNKWLFYEVNERSESGEEELLTVSHITGVTPRSEKEVNMFMAETLEGYKICQPGDLVINTMWAWMGALGISQLHGAVSPSYNVYRLRDSSEMLPKYLDYLYRTPQHIMEINRYSKGVWSSRLRLYPDEFFKMHTPKPPYEEQLT